jgi:catalase
VNYQQLPTNAAKVPVYSPFQRDGKMRFDGNYGADPNYVGSSLQPIKYYQEVKGINAATIGIQTEHEKWVGKVVSYTSNVTDEDFVQPAALWEVIGRESGHQNRLVGNVAAHLSGVRNPELRSAVYSACIRFSEPTGTSADDRKGLFSRINQDLGSMVQRQTEAAVGAS